MDSVYLISHPSDTPFIAKDVYDVVDWFMFNGYNEYWDAYCTAVEGPEFAAAADDARWSWSPEGAEFTVWRVKVWTTRE